MTNIHEIVVKFDTVTSKQHIHEKIEKSKLEAYVLSSIKTWVGSLSNVMSRLNYYPSESVGNLLSANFGCGKYAEGELMCTEYLKLPVERFGH